MLNQSKDNSLSNITMNSPKIPLALPEHICMIDGLEMIEPIDPLRVKALIKSGFCKTVRHKHCAKDIENDKDQLQKYLKTYDKKLGGFKVKYVKSYKHKWSRCYPIKSLGLTAMRKANRATLINETMFDFDMVNAHPKILYCIMNENQEHIPTLTKYCENRDAILDELVETYAVEKDDAKQLIPSILNGLEKGWWSWVKEFGVENQVKNEFIKDFIIEIDRLAKLLKEKNPGLYEIARTSKEGKENKNVLGTFMSLLTGEWEVRILEHCLKRTDMVKGFGKGELREGTTEYDGMKICCKHILENEKIGTVENMIDLLEIWCKEMGFNIEWKVKNHADKMYDIQSAYDEIVEQEKDDENLWVVAEKLRTFMNGHAGVVEVIQLEKKDNFIWKEIESLWYCWDTDANKWCPNVFPLSRYIITEIYPFLMLYLEPFKEELENDDIPEILRTPNQTLYYSLIGELKKFNTSTLRKQWEVNAIINMAKSFLINDLIKFDENPDLFGCNNGVLDIKEEIFRDYRFDDYCTMTCGFSFTHIPLCENEETIEIYELFNKIFPKQCVLDLMLAFYSTGISGRNLQKFFILNGSGGNGKGVLNKFMKWVLGQYFYNIKCACLTEDLKKSQSGGANADIAGLSKKRLVIAEEPAKEDKLNNCLIKNWTGGGEIKGRNLYSKDTTVVNQMSLGLETNVCCTYKEKPTGGDGRRLVDILYESRFTNEESEWDDEKHIYPKNEKYGEPWWLEKHRNTMLNILFKKVIELKNNDWNFDIYVPDCVIERSLAYLQDSDPIHQCFTSVFEKKRPTETYEIDADWSIPKIAKAITNSSAFHCNDIVSTKLRPKLTATVIKEFFMTEKFYSYCRYKEGDKWLLRDWRKKAETLGEDDEV